MKCLRIGDPHIKPNNVEECEKLMHFIMDKIRELKPDRIEILGDLFHTHGIVRLEVLEFWDGWIDTLLSAQIDLYVLVGNHDVGGTEEFAFSALHLFNRIRNRHLKIVQYPRVDGLYAYVSWCNNPDSFVDIANRCAEQGAKVLVCHQTFDGSQYENGFYAPDGIDAKRLNFNLIISGHLHTTQDIEKDGKRIVYPGTPKWDSSSDANLDKGIWLFEHDDNTGAIVKSELIKTSSVVTPIIHLTWNESFPMPEIPPNSNVTMELVGRAKWIEEQSVLLKGMCAITSKRTDKADRKDRQAGKSFPEFVAKRFDTQVDRIELLRYMKELKIV
jgi:DNA repair exonuclease SbcCD nuclease subunit